MMEEKSALWKKEESLPITGWDFSHLCNRYVESPLPWCYEQEVRNFLRPGVRLLDMGTGGGEFLLGLGHPPALTSVTEGFPPNLALCKKRLAPMGITVKECTCEPGERLPFPDGCFDLVINRHESYDIGEIYRVLKENGFFVSQQVGGQNSCTLSRRLLPSYVPARPSFNLENQLELFQKGGFQIKSGDQWYPEGRFLDVGAICWFAKAIPWEFPGFSVEACLPKLLELEQECATRGFVPNREHRFFLIGKKRKG